MYVFIATCLIGSATIFGANCTDLVAAAWNTDKEDAFKSPHDLFPNEHFCFKYLSVDDMDHVREQNAKALLKEQEMRRMLESMQND